MFVSLQQGSKLFGISPSELKKNTEGMAYVRQNPNVSPAMICKQCTVTDCLLRISHAMLRCVRGKHVILPFRRQSILNIILNI
jgi:hypothetical protein